MLYGRIANDSLSPTTAEVSCFPYYCESFSQRLIVFRPHLCRHNFPPAYIHSAELNSKQTELTPVGWRELILAYQPHFTPLPLRLGERKFPSQPIKALDDHRVESELACRSGGLSDTQHQPDNISACQQTFLH